MPRVTYPPALEEAIEGLKRLPGIGPRSAERIALWLCGPGREFCESTGSGIIDLPDAVTHCPSCGFFSGKDTPCQICEDPSRDLSLLCVVEQASDVLPIEKSERYFGLYHVLGGRLSPLDNIGPEKLRIPLLLQRIESGDVKEVILALSSDVEGEATANYLGDVLGSRAELSLTRLAQGLPAGGGLEGADPLTLSRAFENRSGLKK